MPRKSSQALPTGVIDRPGSTALDLRPGAVVSPEVVNVFAEGVSAGAVEGLHLAPLAGRPSGAAIALSVQAWVRNLAYDKDLWVDLRLVGEDAVLHAETLPLAYQEGAEGGGDFFTLGTAVPAPKPPPGGSTTRTLCYRLYGQMNGQVYTDGALHTHEVHVLATPPKNSPKNSPKTPSRSTARAEAPKAAAKPKPPAPGAAPPAKAPAPAAPAKPRAAAAKAAAPKPTVQPASAMLGNGAPKRKPKASS